MDSDSCLPFWESTSDAIILLGKNLQVSYRNPAYSLLAADFKNNFLEKVTSSKRAVRNDFMFEDQEIKYIAHPLGDVYLIRLQHSFKSVGELTLGQLIQLGRTSEDAYVAAAQAIQNSLGWRWVAVTRFKENGRLEVLSFIDQNKVLENFEYDLVGTPCEAVVDTEIFTYFEDTKEVFPDYETLTKLGVQTYAGLVYRDPNGHPTGHVMAMHDEPDVDFKRAEEVIDIVTLVLSSYFQLYRATAQLKDARACANQDELSGIGNRRAYENMLESMTVDYQKRQFESWTIAVIDLDKLKPLNDLVGHDAGDTFIKLAALEFDKLGRETDRAYRIGGDEFVIIFSHSSPEFIQSISRRFIEAMSRIRTALKYPVDASIGLASLNETAGDIPQWVRLADSRMYEDKRKKSMGVKT
jgi:diguanylate cyclase (GGDEF)-like protein